MIPFPIRHPQIQLLPRGTKWFHLPKHQMDPTPRAHTSIRSGESLPNSMGSMPMETAMNKI